MAERDISGGVPRIIQVDIRNYKSISRARVQLGPLTILVGANGAGKSNFIDALAFVAESVSDSVEFAFKSRGGITGVRRRSGGHPTHVGVRLLVSLSDERTADYAFEIAAEKNERFSIARERCRIMGMLQEPVSFDRRHGEFTEGIPGIRPNVEPDRLALFAASATPEFRPLYDFLAGMHFYSIVPSKLRDVEDADPGVLLKRDGSNAAAVLKRIETETPDRYDRICSLLSAAVEGFRSASHRSIERFDTIEFKQDVGLKDPWTFPALNVSDGTLRMLGLLLAVYQPGPASVLGIEEPEATVHPAVVGQILDVLQDASRQRQIVITTHSPDLLDFKGVDESQVRVVTNPQNATVIAPLADSSRDAVRKHLFTPGELLRANELRGDVEAAQEAAEQLSLFGRTP